MIVVSARMELRADAAERAREVGARMAEATRGEEGCLDYRVSLDVGDPSLLYIFEEWASEEALADHMSSPHMADFAGSLPELLGGEVKVTKYQVASSGPLF